MFVYIALVFFEMPQWCILKIMEIEKVYENDENWETNILKSSAHNGFLLTQKGNLHHFSLKRDQCNNFV